MAGSNEKEPKQQSAKEQSESGEDKQGGAVTGGYGGPGPENESVGTKENSDSINGDTEEPPG
jgi:hypothetical protein